MANLLQKWGGHSCNVISPSKGPITEFDTIRSLYKNPTRYLARKVISKYKPDVIIVNTILGYKLIEAFDSLGFNIPIIWYIHESERSHYFDTQKNLSPKIFDIPSKVIFPCEATKKVYEDLDKGNFTYIYNGIDTLSFKKRNDDYKSILKEKYNLPQNSKVLTSIGSFCPRKGQLEFIDAGIELLKEINEPEVHFLLVGKSTPDFDPLVNLVLKKAEKYNIRNRFHIIPETKEMHDIYALTDIAVCNSYIEAFPLVTLEAMATGVPVIASEVYGIAEQIEHNKTGLLILPGNKRELVNAMETLINDNELASQLGLSGKKYVEENFALEKQYQEFETLINSIAKQQSLLRAQA